MTDPAEARLEAIIDALDSQVRHLETELWRLRQDYERLAGDVVYLEGMVR